MILFRDMSISPVILPPVRLNFVLSSLVLIFVTIKIDPSILHQIFANHNTTYNTEDDQL